MTRTPLILHTSLALALTVGALPACRRSTPAGPVAPAGGRPNVLLVTIDTLRADHLGCYGRHRALTPTLDGLAARGVRFATAVAHVPLTAPSHASILTGAHPLGHGVRDNGGYALPARPRPPPRTSRGRLPDGRVRLGLSPEPPLRFRSRLRRVRRPPAEGRRPAARPPRRALRRRDHRRRPALPRRASRRRPPVLPLGPLLRPARAVRAAAAVRRAVRRRAVRRRGGLRRRSSSRACCSGSTSRGDGADARRS